jgi:cephalosporin-C deacetylase-like acetyl esterase
MNRLAFTFSILFLLIANSNFAQEIHKSVFNSNRGANSEWLTYKNNNRALYKIITDEAFRLLDERAEKVSKLKTEDDWTNYNNELKSKIFASLDKFEKTPLNEKVTGKIKKDTYSVEKILFESHPNFYVTGCLFIPKKRQKPAPTVIYCSGHTELGFRSETYQHVILNLVEKGFVVFAFDPMGQGERLQYMKPETGKSKIGGPTKEHTFAGVQTLLTGTSLSDYFIWDGVRTLDFLETRKEVDMKRIGITGRSGGGTQSALIAAYDERIYAAAPECYITSFKRLLQSIGPQDAEQNPYHAIKIGFDHPDFLHLRAPLPSLIVTTTHDFFSQQGARETFTEVQKSYTAFGKPDNLQMTEDFGVHESTKKNRETVYTFFQKHLQLPGDNSDVAVDTFGVEELWVTPTGQLQSSIKGETTFQLNQKYFSKKEISQTQLKRKITELAGIELVRNLSAAVYTGKIGSDNFEIEKYFLENDKADFALPVYVVKNKTQPSNKILVWLSTKGKENILVDDFRNDFLNAGYTIISADLPGIGELFDAGFSGDGFIKNVPFNYTFGANLAGKSVAGIQAESIDLLMQFVAQQNTQKNKIDALVEGELNSSFLHFTSLKNPFSKTVLVNPLESNLSLIKTEFYDPKLAYAVVPGSLPYYDFTDLVSLLPKNSIKIINPVNALGETDHSEINIVEILNFFKQ